MRQGGAVRRNSHTSISISASIESSTNLDEAPANRRITGPRSWGAQPLAQQQSHQQSIPKQSSHRIGMARSPAGQRVMK
jgi:hypothetical protein